MKTETAFDPSRNLIIVEAQVWSPDGQTLLNLALDTGSSETLVVPDILDELGYSPRAGESITSVYSAVGKEQGYVIRVAQFSALGFTLPNFRVHAFDLPDRYGIDGLIGLSFLRQFNYEVRSAEGRILVQLAAS